ncbi:MAG: hypothetical protein ACO35C_04895 [Pontimonas sp.]
MMKEQRTFTKYSAGVLPVAWIGDQLLFLVGEDIRGSDDPRSPVAVSDFGGKAEKTDRNCKEFTAAREFEEETLRMSITSKQILARLQTQSIELRGQTQNGHPYYMFVCTIPFDYHLPKFMNRTIEFLNSKGIGRMHVEKRNVMWLTLPQLLGVGKRSVFEATLNQNEEILREIGSCRPADWDALVQRCKKNVEAP